MNIRKGDATIDSIINRIYKKENITKNWLIRNDFKYSRLFSEENNDAYCYRFPVYKYKNTCILECEFTIYTDDGKVSINVYDSNTQEKYAPFYFIEYGKYDLFINVINSKIEVELKKLGIKESRKVRLKYGSEDKENK